MDAHAEKILLELLRTMTHTLVGIKEELADLNAVVSDAVESQYEYVEEDEDDGEELDDEDEDEEDEEGGGEEYAGKNF